MLVKLVHGGLAQLQEPVQVRVVGGTRPYSIIVPPGFMTDFASIPSYLHWFVQPNDDRITKAAIVHDWLYSVHATSRQVADALFYQIMREQGMPRLQAKVCWRAVNLFGKKGYRYTSPARLKDRMPTLYDRHVAFAPLYELT